MEKHFSNLELHRYARHIEIPEIGIEGQKKLNDGRVLIVGVGGLGSPVAMYLAAAGVGTIGLVDPDVVDLSNLQRQIIYSTDDIGKKKLDAARETLIDLNPHLQINIHESRLTSENALQIFSQYDLVVDCSDNFPTRYLINDACVLLAKPNVYASIFRFEGQVSVFYANKGPCYRCLYPTPPLPEFIPNCVENGVLGVLPGIIGSLQALEVIKIIIGQGESLIGRVLMFDALKLKFNEIKLQKNSECPICGVHPTIHELIDYEKFCSAPSLVVNQNTRNENQITVEELKARMEQKNNLFLLDVREIFEHQMANIGGYLIPLNELSDRVSELDLSREIIIYCQHGIRSIKAVEFLKQQGFKNVRNLVGGLDAWMEQNV